MRFSVRSSSFGFWVFFYIYPTPLDEGKKSTFFCKVACRFEKEANFTIFVIKLIYLWGFQLDQAVLDFELIFVSTLPPSTKVKNGLLFCCKIACRFEKGANFKISFIKLINLWGFQLDQGVLDFKLFFVSTLPPSMKAKNRLFVVVAKSLVDSKKKPIFTIIFIELIYLWGFQLDQAVLGFESYFCIYPTPL